MHTHTHTTHTQTHTLSLSLYVSLSLSHTHTHTRTHTRTHAHTHTQNCNGQASMECCNSSSLDILYRKSAILNYSNSRKGNVLFNNTLNTFYLRLNGIGHMVKHHSERGIPLLPHGLLLPISIKGFFYMHHPRQDSTHHSLCYTSHRTLAGTIF